MRKTIFFLIAVAALAFTAHGGEFSAGQGATSVEPAIANSLSELGVSTQDDPIEQIEAPLIEGYTEDGVQLYGINIYEAEPGCEIYYRCMVEDGGWSDWMVYIDAMMFTEPGHYCIEAFAVAPGKAPSDVVAYEFVLVELTEYTMCPKINIIDHDLGKFVDIIENEPNCNIYFRISSIDGEWSEWIEFISPFVVTDPGIYFIEAYAITPGKAQSEVVYEIFTVVELEQTMAPIFNGFTEDGVQGFGVYIYESEPECDIYYRYQYSISYGNSSEWSEWMQYTDAVMFTEPGNYCVEAYAVAIGKTPSDVVAYEFEVYELIEQTMRPTINVTDHNLGKCVDITENEPYCDIYFRYMPPDGEWSDWMEFFDPIVFGVPGTYIIEAYAQAPGKTQSDVVAKGFVIEESEQTMAPIFNGFTEDGVQGFGVYIYESEPGCDIYYRYQYSISYGNSSEWSEWMQYTDAVMFTEPGNYRIEAYAVAIGKMPSDVVVYEFTVMTIMQPGDLNHDGIIGIEDVTTLIDIIISKGTTTPECDVNQDGSVDIADVTDLIDYILAN